MKKQLQILLSAMLAMASYTPAWAYDFSAVAPSGQTLYYNIIGNGEVEVTRRNYYSQTGNLIIPNRVSHPTNGSSYIVRRIGGHAFVNCYGLTSVTIPNTVTSIGPYAFAGCSGLTSLPIANSVTAIDSYTFSGCDGLVSISIDTLITTIGQNAFYDCQGLTSVTLGNNITSLGTGAFEDCGSLESIVIGDNIANIPALTFYGCSSLTSVSFPSSIVNIGNGAFEGCTSMASIIIPNSVHSISNRAFYGCSNLHIVTIGQSVTNIGDAAFENCISLDTIYLYPETAPTINYNGFAGNASGRVFMLSGCSYDNYYYSSSWSSYVDALRDPDYDLSISVSTENNVYGEVDIIELRGHAVRCDSSAVIHAMSNYGYHFSHWNDGNTANPRTITLTQDTSLTAFFEKNSYTVIVLSYNNTMGQATGGDTVLYLDSITISATSNYGYHFAHWQDNNTDNPRTVQVTQNKTYTAFFDYNQYSISLDVDTAIHGNVNGSGNYNYLSTRTITANPNYGYHFTSWSDGNTDNPRTITLTQDTSFTAYFEKNSYAVTVLSNNNTMGQVTGGDTVLYLDSVTIGATSNYGYHFAHWQDNNTDNPRTVQVTQNKTYTAYFGYEQFALTVQSDNTVQGYVSGGGNYNYLSNRTITATPTYGHHFTYWNDGVTENPRTITLTQDTSFTAHFAPNQYTLTVNAGEHGAATGSGTYTFGDTITIQAFPDDHYHFTRWDDGNTDNPRQYRIEDNITLTAFFAIDTYTVVVVSSDIVRGMVDASGTEFGYGTPCTVTATAYTGYTFAGWSNGMTANPYTFAVISDVELTALFIAEGDEVYTVTVESADPTMGTVSGGGQALNGGTVTITAIPNEGYRFLTWNDGNTENPRTVTVTGNITYTAYFESTIQGIGDIDVAEIKIFASDGRIVVQGVEGMETRVYDLMGREVAKAIRNGDAPVLPTGVYLVKVGALPVRKVVVMR